MDEDLFRVSKRAPRLDIPRKPQVSTELTEAEYKVVRDEAERLDLSMSAFLRSCLKEHFANQE